jgi:hypothetical protein
MDDIKTAMVVREAKICLEAEKSWATANFLLKQIKGPYIIKFQAKKCESH